MEHKMPLLINRDSFTETLWPCRIWSTASLIWFFFLIRLAFTLKTLEWRRNYSGKYTTQSKKESKKEIFSSGSFFFWEMTTQPHNLHCTIHCYMATKLLQIRKWMLKWTSTKQQDSRTSSACMRVARLVSLSVAVDVHMSYKKDI